MTSKMKHFATPRDRLLDSCENEAHLTLWADAAGARGHAEGAARSEPLFEFYASGNLQIMWRTFSTILAWLLSIPLKRAGQR